MLDRPLNRRTALKSIAILILMAIVVIMFFPFKIGSGNDGRIEQYYSDLKCMTPEMLENKYAKYYETIVFANGDIVACISDDSHSSMWAGNAVVKFHNNKYLLFKGHVCGGWFLSHHYEMAKCDNKMSDKGSDNTFTSDNLYDYIKIKCNGSLTSR